MLRRAFARLAASKTLANGTVLDGEFDSGSGHLVSGVAKFPDGRVFSGKFDAASGAPQPKSQLEDEGDLYIGSFNAQWQRSGAGEAWLADGTHYKGTFAEDELVQGEVRIPHGTEEVVFSGELRDEEFVRGTLQQHGFTYEGEFQGNAPHGKGRLEYATGAVLEGQFRNGKLHGADGKMKLESGWIYLGTFDDGVITDGELRTPMYTYEGKFSASGKAHGEGTQIQLVTEPRLIFTGIWVEGQMAQGTVADEYGAPVDYQNRPDLQEKIKPAEDIAVENFLGTKIQEARGQHKQRESDYLEDAQAVLQETGKFPSKADLGYEASSIRQEQEVMSKNARFNDNVQNADEIRRKAAEVGAAASTVESSMEGTAFDPLAAKKAAMSQNSANVAAADGVREQAARFAAKKQEAGQPSDKRNLASNTTWANSNPV